jgi:TatD DNase family protein
VSADVPARARWTDQHCHLDPDSAAETVEEARAAGVERLVNVGTDVENSRRAIEVAARFEGVSATAGVHPHDARLGLDGLEDLLDRPQVVAVGEAGLDYHYDHSPRPVQRAVFAAQIGLARQHDLPLVIHAREAWSDLFDLLQSEGVPDRTVFHCFTGGPVEARRALDLGCHLSFSGIITFTGAPEVREAAALVPLDRLLVETDAPYLAPVPHRGRSNRPAWVPLVGAALAAAHRVSLQRVAAVTWVTAERLYRFGPSGL